MDLSESYGSQTAADNLRCRNPELRVPQLITVIKGVSAGFFFLDIASVAPKLGSIKSYVSLKLSGQQGVSTNE
jgi:hypothetical protein